MLAKVDVESIFCIEGAHPRHPETDKNLQPNAAGTTEFCNNFRFPFGKRTKAAGQVAAFQLPPNQNQNTKKSN